MSSLNRPPSRAISLRLPFVQRALPFVVVSDGAAAADGGICNPLPPCRTEVVGGANSNDQRWKQSCRRLVRSRSNGGLHTYGSAEV